MFLRRTRDESVVVPPPLDCQRLGPATHRRRSAMACCRALENAPCVSNAAARCRRRFLFAAMPDVHNRRSCCRRGANPKVDSCQQFVARVTPADACLQPGRRRRVTFRRHRCYRPAESPRSGSLGAANRRWQWPAGRSRPIAADRPPACVHRAVKRPTFEFCARPRGKLVFVSMNTASPGHIQLTTIHPYTAERFPDGFRRANADTPSTSMIRKPATLERVARDRRCGSRSCIDVDLLSRHVLGTQHLSPDADDPPIAIAQSGSTSPTPGEVPVL